MVSLTLATDRKECVILTIVDSFLGDPSSVPETAYITVGAYSAYPYSRGHMHITGPELTDPLDFDPGYLTDEHDIDLKKLVWAYKKQREIIRRTQMFKAELTAGHPCFPEGSAAASIAVNGPPSEVKAIEYSVEDDRAIEQWVRENVNTTWHSIATAKMAPRAENGVVDENLNVWGTKGLKLADLSIPPMNVGANTNNTAMVVGEKAADIIIRELGIRRSV